MSKQDRKILNKLNKELKSNNYQLKISSANKNSLVLEKEDSLNLFSKFSGFVTFLGATTFLIILLIAFDLLLSYLG